jgi:hypothetical protein
MSRRIVSAATVNFCANWSEPSDAQLDQVLIVRSSTTAAPSGATLTSRFRHVGFSTFTETGSLFVKQGTLLADTSIRCRVLLKAISAKGIFGVLISIVLRKLYYL